MCMHLCSRPALIYLFIFAAASLLHRTSQGKAIIKGEGELDVEKSFSVCVNVHVFMETTWWNNDHLRKILLEQKIDKIEMSPRGERQGGDGERERVKLTALVPVPV